MPNDNKGWMTPALLGAVLGPALQVQQPQLWGWEGYALAAGIAVASMLVARRPHPSPSPEGEAVGSCSLPLRGRAGVGALLRTMSPFVAVTVLAFSLCGLRAIHFASNSLDPQLEGRDIAVTGVVAAMPQRNETGIRFRFDVDAATLAGQPVEVPPRLFLGWYGGAMPGADGVLELQRQAAELHAGERWRMTVRLKAPHGNSNPHGFDYELWLWEQGLQATGYVRAGPRDTPPRRLAATWLHPVERARQDVRDAVLERIPDRKAAGLLAALIVGDQNAIDRADWDIFRATGVAHLMSISGLHITMFAWVAALLVGALWRRSARLCLAWPAQHAALVGGIVLAAAYALFSGWGVPAQRTVWMLATVGLLRLSGRRWPWPQVWLLACAAVVTIDPWALLQAGFWLSFVAVGVLFASDSGTHGERDLSAAGPPQGAKAPSGGSAARLRASVGAIFREQWVITLALTPLTLLLFGQVSVVGLLANAVAIPWVTLVVTPLALAGALVPGLWEAAAGALQALGFYLGWLAALPFATVSAPAPPVWAGAAGVAGGILLAMRLPWHVRVLGVPLLLPVMFWQVARPAPGQFELLAADIGQGNGVIVRTAGHTLVYDAGPRYSAESDAGHRVLVPLLRALDEKVDTLVLSHRDIDHTGGAAAVLAMQPRAALLSSIEAGHELQSLRKSRRCEAGQGWVWDGVTFDVLHPAAADYADARKPNAISCVLRISNGTRSALLAGDIEQAQEAALAAASVRGEFVEAPAGPSTGSGRTEIGGPSTGSGRTEIAGSSTGSGQTEIAGASTTAAGPGTAGSARPPMTLRADVLLVPHHGSKTSSSEAFLGAVQPSFAIVQAGYRNRFGHPATPVLERYRRMGVTVIESPRCGAALWLSAEPARVACQREQAPRYWHHRFHNP